MEIHLAGTQPAPPAECFTGTVLRDPIIQTEAPARRLSHVFRGGILRNFIHSVGTLSSPGSDGCGQGRTDQEVRPGDVVWIRRAKHWQRASPTSGMTTSPCRKRSTAVMLTWMEHVTDARIFRTGRLVPLRGPRARTQRGAPGTRAGGAREAAGADRALRAAAQCHADDAGVGDTARSRHRRAVRGDPTVVDPERDRETPLLHASSDDAICTFQSPSKVDAAAGDAVTSAASRRRRVVEIDLRKYPA